MDRVKGPGELERDKGRVPLVADGTAPSVSRVPKGGGSSINAASVPQPVAMADLNIDRRVTLDEFTKTASRRFTNYDQDQDGRLTAKELAGFDGLVFDPPRAGAEDQSVQIARSAVPLVAAVSCNPGTLARDLSILVGGGYRVIGVTAIDQFLWSPHVEAVALLEKPKKRRPGGPGAGRR